MTLAYRRITSRPNADLSPELDFMEATAALRTRIQEALTLHQQGDLAGAQRGYNDILTQWPEQPDALHMLGIVYMQM